MVRLRWQHDTGPGKLPNNFAADVPTAIGGGVWLHGAPSLRQLVTLLYHEVGEERPPAHAGDSTHLGGLVKQW